MKKPISEMLYLLCRKHIYGKPYNSETYLPPYYVELYKITRNHLCD